MKENPSCVWSVIGPTILCVYKPGMLREEDLTQFVGELRSSSGLRGLVVIPADLVPSPSQRTTIKDWFKSSNARVSVVTESLVARGVVTALRWFNLAVGAFSVNELDAALEFAGVAPDLRANAAVALRTMAEKAGNSVYSTLRR